LMQGPALHVALNFRFIACTLALKPGALQGGIDDGRRLALAGGQGLVLFSSRKALVP